MELCAERKILSKSVVDAIAETYRVKAEYDTAKRKRADNVDALSAALQKARKTERDAQRALRVHVEQHACKASIERLPLAFFIDCTQAFAGV